MRLVEVYTPAEVRACGNMVEALINAGGKAEDILEHAAFARANAKNPLLWKRRFTFVRPEGKSLTMGEVLGACGYEMLRGWFRVGKELSEYGITVQDIRAYIKKERKQNLAATKFGKRSD